ncbi:FadR/GntR family transcriptional regulator [Gordonia terrae]
MTSEVEAIHRPTAGQLVADSIRRKIVLSEFRDGDNLPNEGQLLEQYGVSRPVLREAIRILQSESLLTIRRGSKGGARINAPRPQPVARAAGGLLQYQHTTVFDVFRARSIIEPPAVRILAANRSAATLRQLREALDREAAALDHPRQWGHAHANFHTLLVELSGSNTLALFANIMSDITTAHTAAVLAHATDDNQVRSDAELSHRVHRKLVELVERSDGAEAEKLWRNHLEETTEKMLDTQGSREVLDLFD